MLDTINYKALGRRVREKRREQGWTQEDLAERCDVSLSFIGHIERGTRKASIQTLVALSDALSVSLDYLMADSLVSPVGRETPISLSGDKKKVLREILEAFTNGVEKWND
ncbi:MAG: helix-turn-helix transcriptional regulator [Eubacteriales bacterium]|nr:helix-turn-helix transcriptional regulator [Eubacteriales bacterium]MDD3882966.1 helix-turn-helix transcriptional regulator [Eubacteriales bacterium]MDD4513487.1 helix-turn-helix transcriptional regulator [Eubacteriales bacterium]